MPKGNSEITENIFDLTKIGSKIADIQVEQIPQIFDQDLLIGYTLVDPLNWTTIPINTHIRYLRQDGDFRKGGFITAIINTQDNDGSNTVRFDLISNFSPTAVKWSIFRNAIDKIWQKLNNTPETHVQNNILVELQDELKTYKNALEVLQKEIQKINNEQMRTVLLIKKLHNI